MVVQHLQPAYTVSVENTPKFRGLQVTFVHNFCREGIFAETVIVTSDSWIKGDLVWLHQGKWIPGNWSKGFIRAKTFFRSMPHTPVGLDQPSGVTSKDWFQGNNAGGARITETLYRPKSSWFLLLLLIDTAGINFIQSGITLVRVFCDFWFSDWNPLKAREGGGGLYLDIFKFIFETYCELLTTLRHPYCWN